MPVLYAWGVNIGRTTGVSIDILKQVFKFKFTEVAMNNSLRLESCGVNRHRGEGKHAYYWN